MKLFISEVDRVVNCASIHEAVLERQKLRIELEQQSAAPPRERVCLSDYAGTWLEGKKKTIARATATRYATALDIHILPGEVRALRWSDIDLVGRVLRVRRAQHRGETKETKTGKSRRVAIPEELCELLRRHRETLKTGRAAPGADAGWVFPTVTGKMRFTTTLSSPLDRATEAAEISTRITPHGFRRTFNNLLRQVTTMTVQKSITGHSTDRMAEHYSHVHIDEKHDGVRKVFGLVQMPSKAPEIPHAQTVH